MKLPMERTKTKTAPAAISRHRHRQDHPSERGERRSTEIARRLGKLRVQPGKRRIAGEDHERQVIVDEARDNRPFGIEHRGRLALISQHAQALGDQPLAVQQNDPGIGADQVVRPEGQHGEEEEKRLAVARRGGDGIGGGIADDNGDQGRKACDPRRGQEDPGIERIDDQSEVFKRESVIDPAVDPAPEKAEREDQPTGNDHQCRQPQKGRRHQEGRAGIRAVHATGSFPGNGAGPDGPASQVTARP